MQYLLICLAAFFTAALTLFSGFGLGTVLLPVFALFFPLPIAIALTAVVHLLNNLFKLGLLGKFAEPAVIWRFGGPAILAAFLGARLLIWLGALEPLAAYHFLGHSYLIMPLNLIVSSLMVVFALFELVPGLQRISFGKRYLPIGGFLSGFFGGLSGYQGALRSLFLLKCGLSKEGFIATGVAIACLVDLSRLFVYSLDYFWAALAQNRLTLLAAVLAAFAGSFCGNLLLKQVTLPSIRVLISLTILVIALGLAGGLI
jgi:uncharacterized membrane protein YfcA